MRKEEDEREKRRKEIFAKVRDEKPNEIRLKGKGRKWKRIFLPSFLSSRRNEGGKGGRRRRKWMRIEEGGRGKRRKERICWSKGNKRWET